MEIARRLGTAGDDSVPSDYRSQRHFIEHLESRIEGIERSVSVEQRSGNEGVQRDAMAERKGMEGEDEVGVGGGAGSRAEEEGKGEAVRVETTTEHAAEEEE